MVNIKKKITKNWPVLTIFLLSFLVIWPLLKPGYFSHQDDLHIIRIFEMRQCFLDGQIPCRWVTNMGWGNGFPLFNFYGVLPYYLGASLSFFVGYLVSAKLLFLVALIAGSFGIYSLVNDLWGKYAAVTSSILYLFAPYKALDVYVRGALSESMALSIIPFVFLFGYRLIKNKISQKNIVGFTLSLFFFLITHNIMTVIFLPILLAWLVYWLVVTKYGSLKLVVMTLVLALGMSSFFIFPAFFEKDLVQTESLTRFELDYKANFLSVRQLFFDRTWGYGTSIPGPEGGMSFQVGWPYWLLVVISTVAVFITKHKLGTKLLVAGVIDTFLLSVFMTHNKSTLIWENISILQYFQFPWRFLSLSIFTASILGGFVVYAVKKKWQKAIATLIITLSVVLNWNYFKPREFYDITSLQKLSGELWEQQRRGAILDYLPKTALEPREAAPKDPLVITGEAEIKNFKNRSNRWEFEVDVTKPSEIHVPVYYFPNWEVYVDGDIYPSSHDNLLGRISLKLDSGSYKVVGHFKNTPIRTFSNGITLLSLLGLLIYVKKIKINKIISKYLWIIILALSLPAVRYLFVDGFFGVSDDLHIGWLYEMDRAIKMLQIPPRYVPDLSFGFGYPLFTFVYPLPFYIAEAFHLIGFSLVNSVKLVFGLSIPLSMYTMYRLLRHFMSRQFSLAGAVLYVYAPYRAVEMFVRGTIGEMVAFVFLPLITLSFIKLTGTKKSFKWVGIAGLSTAALVLSHNIMAYAFMPFLIILILARIIWVVKDKKEAITRSFFGLLLGFLTSIYFWLPAIYESRLMAYDTVFNFYDHFPTLKQLITPFFGYGASVPGPYDTMSFYIGFVGLVVVLLGFIFFVRNYKKFFRDEKVFLLWGILIFFSSIFMMNHRSAFLWENLPLLPYFQFPWRFLAMITFCSPIFLLGFSKLSLKKQDLSGFISFTVILLAILLNFNYFKTSEYLGRGDDYYINRYIPVSVASDAYKQTSEEYLRLPKNTEKRPDKLHKRAYTDSNVSILIDEKNALNASITTNSPSEFELNYNKYFYPGWSAKIDGESVEITPGKPFGQITILVPSGEHIVEVEYRESPARLFFDIVTLISLGACIILITKTSVFEKN